MKNDGWLVPDWDMPRGIRAAVSTRLADGVSAAPFDRFNLGLRSGEAIERVEENRRRVIAQLGLSRAPQWLQQVHGTHVLDVRGSVATAADEPIADAAVTAERGQPLVILSADCLPVLLCEDDGRVIGAAHAGWRGLAAGVIERAVAAMDVDVTRVRAWLGPCIGPASYEVGEEVRSAFADVDPGAQSCFVPTRPTHWRCDLAGLARRRLAAMGVSKVAGGAFDTLTDSRFYSYRRDGARSGRFASVIWMDDSSSF